MAEEKRNSSTLGSPEYLSSSSFTINGSGKLSFVQHLTCDNNAESVHSARSSVDISQVSQEDTATATGLHTATVFAGPNKRKNIHPKKEMGRKTLDRDTQTNNSLTSPLAFVFLSLQGGQDAHLANGACPFRA